MKILAYCIESGWENNPWWFCPVSFDARLQKIDHLHTTEYLGAAPSIFKGSVSGLVFNANCKTFPIEARCGELLVAESEKSLDQLENWQKRCLKWSPISKDEAIKMLQV